MYVCKLMCIYIYVCKLMCIYICMYVSLGDNDNNFLIGAVCHRPTKGSQLVAHHAYSVLEVHELHGMPVAGVPKVPTHICRQSSLGEYFTETTSGKVHKFSKKNDNDGVNDEGMGLRLVRLRNPWGGGGGNLYIHVYIYVYIHIYFTYIYINTSLCIYIHT